MTKIRDAGVIPMAVSDKDGWQGGHLLSMSLSSEVGGPAMDELINGETPWTDPSVVKALQVWQTMSDDKLLPPSPTAINYDNGNALFYSGKAAMNPTGSWLALDIERNVEVRASATSRSRPRRPGIFSGGLGSGSFISASSTKADAAEEFLDYGSSTRSTARGRWRSCRTSRRSRSTPPASRRSPLFEQVLADTAKIADGTGDFGYNIDVLTSDTFNNAMWNGMQGMLTGQTTPEEVAAQLQKNYKKPTD